MNINHINQETIVDLFLRNPYAHFLCKQRLAGYCFGRNPPWWGPRSGLNSLVPKLGDALLAVGIKKKG